MLSRSRRFWFITLSVLGVVVLLGVGWVTQRLVHGGPVTDGGGPQDKGVLSETVRDGQLEFRASNLVCGLGQIEPSVDHPDTTQPVMTSGQFCTVDLFVRNTGTQARSLTPENLRAHTDEGRKITAHREATELLALEIQKPFQWYAQDAEGSFTIVFELYPSESVTSFEFHDSTLSKGAVVAV